MKVPSVVKISNKDDMVIDPVSQTDLQNLQGFVLPQYDYIGVGYPNATTETYTYRTGGAAGTVVGTITVVYSDSTKTTLLSVTKT